MNLVKQQIQNTKSRTSLSKMNWWTYTEPKGKSSKNSKIKVNNSIIGSIHLGKYLSTSKSNTKIRKIWYIVTKILTGWRCFRIKHKFFNSKIKMNMLTVNESWQLSFKSLGAEFLNSMNIKYMKKKIVIPNVKL